MDSNEQEVREIHGAASVLRVGEQYKFALDMLGDKLGYELPMSPMRQHANVVSRDSGLMHLNNTIWWVNWT